MAIGEVILLLWIAPRCASTVDLIYFLGRLIGTDFRLVVNPVLAHFAPWSNGATVLLEGRQLNIGFEAWQALLLLKGVGRVGETWLKALCIGLVLLEFEFDRTLSRRPFDGSLSLPTLHSVSAFANIRSVYSLVQVISRCLLELVWTCPLVPWSVLLNLLQELLFRSH